MKSLESLEISFPLQGTMDMEMEVSILKKQVEMCAAQIGNRGELPLVASCY